MRTDPSDKRPHLGRSVSRCIVGLLVATLLVTVGFAVSLRFEKGAELEAALASRTGAPRQLILKLGHSLGPRHPVHRALEFFGRRLEQLSGAAVALDIYPSGVLGSEVECLEQLQNGSLAMTKVSAAVMENFVPEMSVFGLPYLFRDSDHFWQVLEGPVGRKLLRRSEEKLLHGLCYYDAGARSFYTRTRPVRSPTDLVGMKIRVMNSATAIEMVTVMGGAPTPIAWGELYSALAQGAVDGAENNLPSFTSNRHYEVCKHFSLDEHTRIPDVLLIGTKTWQRLPAMIQEWIQQAADESSRFQRKLWHEETVRAREIAARHGVTIHEVDTDPFAARAAPMLVGIENAAVRDMIDRIREMR